MAVNSRDITESRQRDGQLRQAEKMEALGRLTGGLAHDYNNLLMILNGCSEVALDAPGAPPQMLEMLRQIYAAGERAAKLTRQLLTFSQKQVARRERANLNDILAEIVKTLPPMMGGDISLELKPHPGLPPILADAAMIDQAVMNLALNARDAMPQGGTLLLATEPVFVSETGARNWGAGRAGEFVCLVVKDSGAGIPAEILPQVFEPFFTTKAEGEGPGLGLSTVFGIVKQHLGWLTVESEPGHGSAFRIYLPAESPVAAQPGGEAATAKGSGAKVTVLVVEDEDALRELAVVMLEKLGYRALQAADGDEALEVWQRHGHRIDLLLTDIVMPGSLTGRQLAEQLQRVKPSLKVIYSSGCATASAGEMLGIRESALFLQKPYSPRNLAEALRFCFDTKATTS